MSSLPDSMRAVEIAGHGGPEVLRLVERPMPTPGRGEVLIKVAAAGVKRPGIMQRLRQKSRQRRELRKGLAKHPPPRGASALPGLEVAGEIVAGLDAAIGRHVCALVTGGG